MKQSDWPTLGQLIDSGKRVVVFLDSGADVSSVPFILPEFEMVRLIPMKGAVRDMADSASADLGDPLLRY
jgi:hypothetical protein